MNENQNLIAELEAKNAALQQEITKLQYDRKRIEKSRVKISVLLLALLLISMITTTVAWFTISSIASVDNMKITIGTGVQLLISDEDHGTTLSEYTNEVTSEQINKQLSTYNTSLEDILLDPLTTSDGKRFYTQRGVERQANDDSFLQFDLFFISSEDMWVHLTSSESEPGANDGTLVFTDSTGRQSDIINCARISFTDNTTGDTVIYEPNKGTPVAGQTTFDITSPMTYTNATRLFHLEPLTPKMVTVRIWLEGEDPECDDDVQQANLQVQLNFEGTDDNNIPVN